MLTKKYKPAPFRSTESKCIEMNIEIRADEVNDSLRGYNIYINGQYVFSFDKPEVRNAGGLYNILLKKLTQGKGFPDACFIG